jgi:predicted acyltransferase
MYTGFTSHWNKNSNLGQAFDVWFLNILPRPSRFLYNDGGYLTLSFIPTLGTMLLGVAAGRWFHESAPNIPVRKFLLAAMALCAAGLLLHVTGVCPIVKRIWTPAWTLFSGGVCFFFLAAFSWVIDVRKHRGIAFPLVVVGMNSIAAYVIAELRRKQLPHSSGNGSAQLPGTGTGANISRRSHIERLLVDSVLDVQEEDLRAHLK